MFFVVFDQATGHFSGINTSPEDAARYDPARFIVAARPDLHTHPGPLGERLRVTDGRIVDKTGEDVLEQARRAKEDEVWAAIRAELDKHYDQPWQMAAQQLNAHYRELLGRHDVDQALKDQVMAVMPLLVRLWAYLLAGSSAAGATRVSQIRGLATFEEVLAYQVDLGDWVANDPQITMSQITIPAALAILPAV